MIIVRAFAKLRHLALTHKEPAAKLAELQRKVAGRDDATRQLVAAIRELIDPSPQQKPKRHIGFTED